MPRFKKREEDLVTHFDKWLYVLKNLPKLQERPKKLKDKVFEKLFNEAELAKLTPDEMRTYEESLKVYRDNYSVIETAKNEGRNEERIGLAREMKKEGLSVDQIARITRLTKGQIEKLSGSKGGLTSGTTISRPLKRNSSPGGHADVCLCSLAVIVTRLEA